MIDPEDRDTDKYWLTSLLATVCFAMVVLFQHRLGFDMSEFALGALGIIVGAYNLAMGYVEAHRFSLYSINPNPPDAP